MITIKQRTKTYGHMKGCEICDRRRGLIRRHGMHLCRQCFRDSAAEMGFKKFS